MGCLLFSFPHWAEEMLMSASCAAFASSSLPEAKSRKSKGGVSIFHSNNLNSGVGCYDPHEVNTNRKASPNELHFPPVHITHGLVEYTGC